jgi:hypothetical protein
MVKNPVKYRLHRPYRWKGVYLQGLCAVDIYLIRSVNAYLRTITRDNIDRTKFLVLQVFSRSRIFSCSIFSFVPY